MTESEFKLLEKIQKSEELGQKAGDDGDEIPYEWSEASKKCIKAFIKYLKDKYNIDIN